MERTQLVLTQKDLSDAPATLVSMEMDTTAQVKQYHYQRGGKRLQKTAMADHYQKKNPSNMLFTGVPYEAEYSFSL